MRQKKKETREKSNSNFINMRGEEDEGGFGKLKTFFSSALHMILGDEELFTYCIHMTSIRDIHPSLCELFLSC